MFNPPVGLEESVLSVHQQINFFLRIDANAESSLTSGGLLVGSAEVAASRLRSFAICDSRALVCRSRETSLLFLFRESDLFSPLSPLRPWSWSPMWLLLGS